MKRCIKTPSGLRRWAVSFFTKKQVEREQELTRIKFSISLRLPRVLNTSKICTISLFAVVCNVFVICFGDHGEVHLQRAVCFSQPQQLSLHCHFLGWKMLSCTQQVHKGTEMTYYNRVQAPVEVCWHICVSFSHNVQLLSSLFVCWVTERGDKKEKYAKKRKGVFI